MPATETDTTVGTAVATESAGTASDWRVSIEARALEVPLAGLPRSIHHGSGEGRRISYEEHANALAKTSGFARLLGGDRALVERIGAQPAGPIAKSSRLLTGHV